MRISFFGDLPYLGSVRIYLSVTSDTAPLASGGQMSPIGLSLDLSDGDPEKPLNDLGISGFKNFVTMKTNVCMEVVL